MMTSPFYTGARDSLPLIFAAMPFGLVFGAMGHAQGLSDWVTMGMSLMVFAGASQFIAMTLLGAGASPVIIVMTVMVVNLRHMLYSISLIPHIQRLPHWQRVTMGFGLTDETYAVTINRLTQPTPLPSLYGYYSGSQLLMYGNWQLCTWLGIVVGDQLPQVTELGLDIAMVVAFIGIIVPGLNMPSKWRCALVAAVAAIFTYDWPHQSGLLFSSVIAIVAGVYTERHYKKEVSL